MLRFLLKRLGFAILVVFCVQTAAFLITHALGNPVRLLLPLSATDTQIAAFSHAQGFDRSLLAQYWDTMSSAAHGDFKTSYWQQLPARGLVLDRLPATAELVLSAMFLAIVVSVPLGVLAAVKRDSIWDKLAVTFSLVGISIPGFWLGELLILVFAVGFNLLPTSGYGGPEYFVLPVLSLAALPLGRLTQIVRSAMLDQLGQQYVLVGRSLGLSTRNLIFRHALKNAAIPIVTLMGWEFGRLIAGFTVVIEVVFNWPGAGQLAIQAIQHHDIPLIEADVTIVATLVVALNFLLDIVYAALDPRVKHSGVRRRSLRKQPKAADGAPA